MKILEPIAQPNLFGYEKYFNHFVNLYKSKKLPNVILLRGPKGIGKSTFAYHFANFILTQDEKLNYSLSNFSINLNNSTFNLINNKIHPNFFSLDSNKNNENIKIDQVRNLLKFISKTTYSKNIRIILIDNAEFLNINSSNALLKSLEESTKNNYFFIIQNSSSPILDTIKSRGMLYNIHFTLSEKRDIFKKISEKYDFVLDVKIINNFLYFDSPGNLLNYHNILSEHDYILSDDLMPAINLLMDKYKNNKDSVLLNYISSFIEYFYSRLSFNNRNNLNIYFTNNYKILKLIDNMKKFNLDKKNLLISIKMILANETK